MTDSRWDALFGGDPAQIERGLDRWVHTFEERADRLRDVSNRIEEIRVTESVDGVVTVTVDSNGLPTAMTFSDRVQRIPHAELGPMVLRCIRQAQSRISGQVEHIVSASTSDIPETAHTIVANYRERFGDGADSGSLGAGTNTRETASQPVRRPPRPADDEDFGTGSIMH